MVRASRGKAISGVLTIWYASLILWVGYSSCQLWFHQGSSSHVPLLLPGWLYRALKHDWTALTDALLYLALYMLWNGKPDGRVLVESIVPTWVLEDRPVEMQIFAMTSVLAVLAGLIVYRGEDSREKEDDLFNWVFVPVFLLSIGCCMWINEVKSAQDLLHLVIPQWLVEGRPMELRTFSMIILLAGLAGVIVWRGDEKPHVRFAGMASQVSESYPLPPALIPGRTTHTRLFPEKHSFDYSYLSVGVPVGWTGCAGSALSCDVDHLPSVKRRRGWFDISGKKYLNKDGKGCLEHKLARYLHEQGVPDDDWTFAYLVTAPRFLGYSFNPVSFWYIYNANDELSMMILEVNNTFDERRMYLLKAQPSPSNHERDFPTTSIRFSNAWQKDFHVSPFNDRQGTYTLTATDPRAAYQTNKSPTIDNTIVLKDPSGSPKLIARVFSSSLTPAATLSTPQLTLFLTQWFWTGFATFPRIIRQAGALYFKHHLPVFYKPEILPSSIARAATPEETSIEPFFRAHLHKLVAASPKSLRTRYVPPPGIPGSRSHTFLSRGATAADEAVEPDAVFHVLSPAFYSRLVHYKSMKDALCQEAACADERNRIVLLSGPDNSIFDFLFTAADDSSRAAQQSGTSSHSSVVSASFLERLAWLGLRKTRCPPPAVSYPPAAVSKCTPPLADQETGHRDSADSSLSPLDGFARRECEDGNVYRRAVMRLFLAERFTAGFPALLDLGDLVLRIGLLSFAVSGVGGVVGVGAVHVWAAVKRF